jgi:hypothetical protein
MSKKYKGAIEEGTMGEDTTEEDTSKKPEDTALVAFRQILHNGVLIEIGEPVPEDLSPRSKKGRNFAPANIAGNMRARRQYFLKLDAKKK